RFDVDDIIVGGGIGGLTVAALLARRGRRVLLLEAHTSSGGCAGYFDRFDRGEDGARRRYRFDVGATTISGVARGQSLRALFSKLGDEPVMRRIEPGMVCMLKDGTLVTRYSDRERWIAECERLFGGRGQRQFWEEIFSVNDRAWGLSEMNRTFPPKSLGDLLRMARPANIANLPLLRYITTPVLAVMRRYGLADDERFGRFIDEQLMITAQNISAHTPFLIGAMGLAYPTETWYADGGMYALAELLERAITGSGGEIRFKRLVTALRPEGDGWRAETARGESLTAERIISNATMDDMMGLMESDTPGNDGYFRRQVERGGAGWGAFTLYCAVRDTFQDHGTLYHQIHTSLIAEAESGSVFVSLSHRDDHLRAPAGWRTMTVSTHIANPARWLPKPGDAAARLDYEERKELLAGIILDAIGGALPGFAEAEKKFLLTGTPRTFQFYTHRKFGMVGGIPHAVERNILGAPKFRTPFRGLYMVGDTVYPGQGIPAVVLGAMNLVAEIG
ncbi:MAG: NAD(P)/FAD-dependent oxidoreductase, partial [Bacteroidota bacterium]